MSAEGGSTGPLGECTGPDAFGRYDAATVWGGDAASDPDKQRGERLCHPGDFGRGWHRVRAGAPLGERCAFKRGPRERCGHLRERGKLERDRGGGGGGKLFHYGLTSETDYDIYFVGRDSAGNVQTSPTLVEERTADITPPSFGLSYPRFTGIRGTSALINFDLNEISKVHFVLVPASATAPTASEVMALTASGGADATACGTVDVNSQIAGTTRFSATRNVTSVTDAVMSSRTCEDSAYYGLSGESAMKCSTCVQLSESMAYKV